MNRRSFFEWLLALFCVRKVKPLAMTYEVSDGDGSLGRGRCTTYDYPPISSRDVRIPMQLRPGSNGIDFSKALIIAED